MRKISVVFMILAVLFMSLPSYAQEDGINAAFNAETGELHIKGSGVVTREVVSEAAANEWGSLHRLKTVVIEGSITEIGESAFYECKNMERVILPDSVNKIGKYAFSGCDSLHTINFPNDLKEICDYAFRSCRRLNEIALNDGLKIIGASAFSSAYQLERVRIPETIERVGANAFYETPWLKNAERPLYMGKVLVKYYGDDTEIDAAEDVTVREGTVSIAVGAFQGSKRLKSLVLPDSVVDIGTGGYGEGAFRDCVNLEEIRLSDNISVITNQMFSGCVSLKEIVIPENVTMIGDRAFSNCMALTDITIPKNIEIIGNAFNNTPWYEQLSGTVLINGNLLKTKPDENGNVEIPEGTVRIMPALLYQNSDVKTVKIPESVKNIGYSAFSECKNLIKINIPSGIEEIENHAFSYSPIQGDIVIPSTIRKIGMSAFYDTDITSVLISESEGICEVGANAFFRCEQLKSADVGNCVGDSMFALCSQLESVKIRSGARWIPGEMFSECYALKNVEIPDTVTEIGMGAFNCCIALKEINIPEAVTEIGNMAFANCISLDKVRLPQNLLGIDGLAFTNTNITELTIPEGVTYIGERLCDGIDHEVNIYASSDVERVKKGAFSGENIVVHTPRNSSVYKMAVDDGAKTVITGNMAVGEVYDKIIPTDIIATINGTKVNSYAIYGETIILLRDLENTGFDVSFNKNTKTATADFNKQKEFTNEEGIKLTDNNLLHTDIKVMVNGVEIPGYNTNGYMAIVAEDLGRLVPEMSYEWVNEERTLKIFIE